jgi:hypothetical protein
LQLGCDHVAEFYVDVRANESDAPVKFPVTVADLLKPPEGVNDFAEIDLEGDRHLAIAE